MRHLTKSWMVLLAGLAVFAGCGTDRTQLQAFLNESEPVEVADDYRVMPPDVVAIVARPASEFQNFVVQVGPDGNAFLPLVGNFQMGNKTTTQISAELAEQLSDYYQDIQVTVTVRQFNSQRFYVFGQVTRPGAYAYTGSDSLLSALAEAQPTALAMPERIELVRGQGVTQGGFLPELDENGRVKGPDASKLVINLNDMVRKGDLSANVMLAHNDVIYVPANPLAAVGLTIQTVLFPIRPAAETAVTPGRVASGIMAMP